MSDNCSLDRKINILNEEIEQLPGCMPVKINNYQQPQQEIKLFGLTEKESSPQGTGVGTYQKEVQQGEGLIAWFNIKDLVEQKQYTEEVTEIIIKAGETELGRKKINLPAGVYLG